MAALQDLIAQIEDPVLRDRIAKEVDKLTKSKKFGLVFEEHIPECTPLYDMPVKKGCQIILRNRAEDKSIYIVQKIENGQATCFKKEEPDNTVIFSINDVVRVAEFGEPIYPYLEPIDSVCNAPDSDLWHTLIEADNYHALQLLEYVYAGKVDCIYIDPPYNTGARDWKYNNDYVDSGDAYRHSKWLSMMGKRLKLAKELLNPKDSVLIVTIDEKEYLHLGCLLEQTFSGSRIQMVSDLTNPKGVTRNGFRRADEYIFFVMIGNASPVKLSLGVEWSPSVSRSESSSKSNVQMEPGWTSMMRRGSHSSREERPGLYYAIYADPVQRKIVKIGNPIPFGQDKDREIDGLVQIRPIRANGSLGRWQVGPEELKRRISQGRVRLGRETDYGYVVNYLSDGEYKKIDEGLYTITGYEEDGSLIAHRKNPEQDDSLIAPTQWKIASHDSSAHGSTLLGNIFDGKRFTFPKSLYSEHDAIQFFVANKPNALIIDFFAGSGTTLHAVNLLNAEDNGHRRCIMVTNNEVSDGEANLLTAQGYQPGDKEWEQYGIAKYVTWPRTVCSIEGHDINGEPLKGNYLGSDIPMADGFKTNVAYFKLGFLDKTSIALGMQFKEMIPTLWMKAGAIGPCPVVEADIPDMLILSENRFAVLNNEDAFSAFAEELNKYPEIQTVFLVTDYEVNYRSMVKGLNVETTYQLYRDYLDNFQINHGRD